MTAYEELKTTGRLGPSGAALLYKTVAAVAVGRRFPPPAGHQMWDETAVQEAAHDFLTEDRGPKRLSDIFVRAVDDESFEKLLHGAVLNFYRDRSRRTDFGAFLRRVRGILDRSDSVVAIPGTPERWKLAAGPGEPSGTPTPDLAAAAAAELSVVVPTWSGRRRAPVADFESLERLCVAVLNAAQGSLPLVDIARAITARIDPGRGPLTLELDVLEQIPDQQSVAQPEAEALAFVRSSSIFESLSDRERTLLAARNRPARDLDSLLGLRKSQASVVRQQLSMRLSDELAGESDGEAVLEELWALADDWMIQRTDDEGSAL